MLIQRLTTLAGISGVVVSVCAAGAFAGACAAQGGGTDVGGSPSGSNTSGSNTSGSNTSGNNSSSGSNASGSNTSGSNSGTYSSSGSNSGTGASGSGPAATGTSGTATSGTGASGTAPSGTGASGTASGTGASGTGAAGAATSGTVAASGTATGTATSGAAAGSCAVTSTGGLPLVAQYLSTAGGNPGTGGYTFSYDDMLGSVTCIQSTAFCGSGSIAAQNPPTYTIFGGGIGVNLSQMMATTATPPPMAALTATGSGIKYAVTSIPSLGMRIAIDNMGTSYCAAVATASGTIPWASFNTKCYTSPPSGTALSGPPSATQIEFQVPSGMAAGTFDFCVTAVGFAP